MFLRVASALVLCVSLAKEMTAEDNCGEMMRTATRFRAVVRSIEPIGSRDLKVTPVDDGEMRFIVTVDVESVKAESPALKAGERLHFGVHSPSRILGTGESIGKAVDFEAEWMTCDKVFRRFVGLRIEPPNLVVENPEWWLEIGHTYRAKARWEDSDLRLVTRIRVPMHHSFGIDWANVDAFPQVRRDGKVQEVDFEVVSIRISQLGEREWLSMYDLKIVAVRSGSRSAL